MTTADTTPEARPTLAEAFPDGDAQRFDLNLYGKCVYGLALILAALSIAVLATQGHFPSSYVVVHGIGGVVLALGCGRLLLREIRVSPDALEVRGIANDEVVLWRDVASICTVRPGKTRSEWSGLLPGYFGAVLSRFQREVLAVSLPPGSEWMSWIVALTLCGAIMATFAGVKRRLNRRRLRAGDGCVCVLRDADGRVLLVIADWLTNDAHSAVKRAAAHYGIPVERRAPGAPA